MLLFFRVVIFVFFGWGRGIILLLAACPGVVVVFCVLFFVVAFILGGGIVFLLAPRGCKASLRGADWLWVAHSCMFLRLLD